MHQDDIVDVAIVGAGTVGLCAAVSLLAQGLSVAIVDPRSASSLEHSEYDGRDVALSTGILSWLDTLNVLQHLSREERSPIRGARVMDLDVSRSLSFGPAPGSDRIGEFIPEHRLRDQLFALIRHHARLRLYLNHRLTALQTAGDRVCLTLDDGQEIAGRLLAAADGRGSKTRALLGIKQQIDDQGFDMLCCRVRHDQPQDGWTMQQFDDAGCIATLPLNGQHASLALMLKPAEADRLMMMKEGAFCAYLDTRLKGRLGMMSLSSSRYRMPLSGTYAEQFRAPRAVLLGDAAVGMLPITAHGLNLGLLGVRSLAAEVAAAQAAGQDIGSDSVTHQAARRAQLTARPLYTATQEISRLFTRHDAVSYTLRRLAMMVGHPFQHLVGLNSEQRDARTVPWIGALRDSLSLWKLPPSI